MNKAQALRYAAARLREHADHLVEAGFIPHRADGHRWAADCLDAEAKRQEDPS